MSEMDMDRLPRMKDTLRPEDLNTDACVTLAAEILKGAANALSSRRSPPRGIPARRTWPT